MKWDQVGKVGHGISTDLCKPLMNLCYPFTTMDNVHLPKHAMMSLLTNPPPTVYIMKYVLYVLLIFFRFDSVL